MSSQQFVNPYNFIPIAKQPPQRSANTKGNYSGVINYRIRTKTPLFIPNTSSEDAFKMGITDHKSYDFFSYNDLSDEKESVKDRFFEPVIPGSEIRGMIRSNYEIITNSCLPFVDDDDVLSKRTDETYKPGLISKTGAEYVLMEAEDCLMRTMGANDLRDDWAEDEEHYARKCYIQNELKEGEKVFFEYVKREEMKDKQIRKYKPLAYKISKAPSEKAKKTGYIIKGEDGPDLNNAKQQKHCCHVFAPKQNIQVKSLTQLEISSLRDVIKAYVDNGIHDYSEYSAELEKFFAGQDGEMFPVYYSKVGDDNSYVMLSPACITREIYKTKIRDLLHKHINCNGKDKLCPACALFGILGKDESGKSFQVTSRLRFSDAYLTDEFQEKYKKEPESLYVGVVTLRPLSSPKLSNMEFYLKKPNEAWFWTYDYYIDSKGEIHVSPGELNGRKFYWHNMNPNMDNQEADGLNTTIRPIVDGIEFYGSVFFDSVSKEELDQLIYTLEAGDNEIIGEKKHGYKLGHAKPLGLGSVAIQIDTMVLHSHKIDPDKKEINISEEPYEEYKEPDIGIKKEFEKMTDFEAVKGENVAYPIPKNAELDRSEPVYKWFIENHLGYVHKYDLSLRRPKARKQMVFAEHLVAMEPKLQPTGYRSGVIKPTNKEKGAVNKKEKHIHGMEARKNYRGEIIKFLADKGYGFIKVRNMDQDVYFIVKNFVDPKSIQIGALVEFEMLQGDKGPYARNCKIIEQ